MHIVPQEKVYIARLFQFFLQAEQLAGECALRQSNTFPDIASRNFFAIQARQEKFHARVFQCGIGILAPKGIGRASKNDRLATYRQMIGSALACNDLAGSLLSVQVILEGLGDVAIERIGDGMSTRGFGFKRIKKMILGQEDAHHAYGLKRLLSFYNHDSSLVEECRSRFDEFYGEMQNVAESMRPLFEHFEENPQDYLDQFESGLPALLKPVSSR